MNKHALICKVTQQVSEAIVFCPQTEKLENFKNNKHCDDCWPRCLCFFPLVSCLLFCCLICFLICLIVCLFDCLVGASFCLFVWLFVCLIDCLVGVSFCLFVSFSGCFFLDSLLVVIRKYHLSLDNSSMTSNQFSKLWHLSTMIATRMNEGFVKYPYLPIDHSTNINNNYRSINPHPNETLEMSGCFLQSQLGHRCHLVICLTISGT